MEMISGQSEVLHTPSHKRGAAAAFVIDLRKRGRIGFCLEELMAATGLSELAARRQLTRLFPEVVRVTPRQEFFLIVDPEHQTLGAPPPSWWLDAYFAWLGRPYYLALQSAAAEYGSTLQALQVTQVMTDRPRRDIVLGRVRVQFFVKNHAGSTPTQAAAHAFAPLAVSTPAATVVDLVQYAPRIGGIERSAETILPLLPGINRTELLKATSPLSETPTLQRLGFVLESLGFAQLANALHPQLPRSLRPVALNLGGETVHAPVDPRWSVHINAAIGPAA